MPATNQSVIIDAPIEAVWEKLSNFHDLSWAPNVISSVDIVGSVGGSSPGAKRILNGVFHETMFEINNDEHVLKYTIDDGPSPVSKDDVDNYVGIIQLSNATDASGTLVDWSSSWDCSVDDAVEFCQGIYVALLGDLEKSFE